MSGSVEPQPAPMWRHLWWMSLVALPLLVSWPIFLGLSSDPMLTNIGLLSGGHPGLLAGSTNLDLNVGATTQALGHLAAEQWLRGAVPWWNPYNGLGMPLAGEMQSSALFLPFVLLLHFHDGPWLLKMALQMIAGPACFALLRRLGIARPQAWFGGLAFALSGSFAWLGHAPIMPLAFLPLFVLGIENARQGGYRLLAVALAFSIYAGFPETAYLDGLFALAWTIWRLRQSGERLHFARRVALGGVLGLLLAAPSIWSFVHLLLHGSVENHAVGGFARPIEPAHPSVYAVWLFPYVLGPLLAFTDADSSGGFGTVIANLGGYVGLVLLLLALAGLRGATYRGLRMWLALWIAVSVMRSAAVPGITQLVNLIPMLRETIVSRYAIGSWHFAAILLGVLTISDWRAGTLPHRVVAWAAAGTLAVAAFTLALAWPLLRLVAANQSGFAVWPVGSVAWGLLLAGLVAALLRGPPRPLRLAGLLLVLSLDAVAMFTLPMLSGQRGDTIDTAAIGFLHAHTGLQRFYTLGPYRPNYGAYFETAQLNHEYLPIPSLWRDYIRRTLDPTADRIMFRGDYPPTPPGQSDHGAQMIAHLANFEALAVRYVVTPSGDNPFVPTFATQPVAPHATTRPLAPGQSTGGTVAGNVVPTGRIATIGVELATYLGQADGVLAVELCGQTGCVHGSLDVTTAADNAVADIALQPALAVRAGETLRWSMTHNGGSHQVALWLPGATDSAPRLTFTLTPDQRPPPRVYHDRTVDIYELPNAAPYFETQGGPCQLHFDRRTDAIAHCDGPARLIRRELFFSGWRARLNGQPAAIAPYHQVLEQIALPAGFSVIRFRYAPPYAGLCWWLAGLGGLGLVIRRSPRHGSIRRDA